MALLWIISYPDGHRRLPAAEGMRRLRFPQPDWFRRRLQRHGAELPTGNPGKHLVMTAVAKVSPGRTYDGPLTCYSAEEQVALRG